MAFSHNGPEFMKRVLGKAEKFYKKAEVVAKGVGLQCLADLQVESPVDYGRYRAAHTLTIMEPSRYIPPPPTKTERKTHIKGQAIPKYTQLALEQIQKADEKLGEIKIKHGVKIFITNNVDYALRIEDGSYSKDSRAPKAIYGIVAARYNRLIQKEWAKLKAI